MLFTSGEDSPTGMRAGIIVIHWCGLCVVYLRASVLIPAAGFPIADWRSADNQHRQQDPGGWKFRLFPDLDYIEENYERH